MLRTHVRSAFRPATCNTGDMSVQRSRVNREIESTSIMLGRGSKRARLSKRLRQDAHLTRPSASSAQYDISRASTCQSSRARLVGKWKSGRVDEDPRAVLAGTGERKACRICTLTCVNASTKRET